MKRFLSVIFVLCVFFVIEEGNYEPINALDRKTDQHVGNQEKTPVPVQTGYIFPDFYRGIYLNVGTARNYNKLKVFVESATKSYINTFVIDAQDSRYKECVIPEKNIRFCIAKGIHPIARIVVFPEGLRQYPIPDKIIMDKLDIAESCCRAGFREIQFDYIRFYDSNRLKHVSVTLRQQFIECFLSKARKRLSVYNAKIAADIFGRIPLNRNDIIGQHMESLDRVVDIICPMAYPSHYWTKKLQHSPYHTVKWTSEAARKRTKNAEIVTYIQAFKMKMPSNMSYSEYIKRQIQAVHDAEIRGFFMWNARQDYRIPLDATREYYMKLNQVSENPSERKKVM